MRRRRDILFCMALTALAFASAPAVAAPKTDFSKGAFYGRVVDTAGQPIVDATVAIRDKKGNVVAWTKTNARGEYAIAADTLKTLRLEPSRRRGTLEKMANGVGQVLTAPVKLVSATVRAINPVDTARAAAVSTVTGNPGPIVSQVATSAAAAAAGSYAKKRQPPIATEVLGARLKIPRSERKEPFPGEVILSVDAPEYREVRSMAGAYWLEPGAGKTGPRAWLETAKLAPAHGEKASEIPNMAILLADPEAEPSLVPAGSSIHLSVRLKEPAEPGIKARVFARGPRDVIELVAGDGGIYSGDMAVSIDMPPGDTKISLAALRAEPIELKFDGRKGDPLKELAARLNELEPGKAYDFDPRLLASENRLDLPITILDPKQATPR